MAVFSLVTETHFLVQKSEGTVASKFHTGWASIPGLLLEDFCNSSLNHDILWMFAKALALAQCFADQLAMQTHLERS